MSTTELNPECNGHDQMPGAVDIRAGSREAGRTIDLQAVERAAADLLVALGADLRCEGLCETPRRMADAYAELLSPEPFNLTTFPNDEGYDELVVVRDIPARRRGCRGSRASVHVPARRAEAWNQDRDLRPAWACP